MEDMALAKEDMITGLQAAAELAVITERQLKISMRQALVAFGVGFVSMSRDLGIDDDDAVNLLDLLYDLHDQFEQSTEGTEH